MNTYNHKAMKVLIPLLLLLPYLAMSQTSDWVAPKEADALKNPYPATAASMQQAKAKFQQLCVICHGDKGKGDGVAGMALKPKPANFTTTKVQSESDGAIFWKMTNGRAPMAAYKDILTDQERWELVNYIRTFKKSK